MTRVLIECAEPVTLVGGVDAAPATLARATAYAPTVVAADGGVGQAVRHGLNPLAVIGDMDSLPSEASWRNSDIRMFRLAEQDTTDFEKCLYSVDAPLILGCGFLGGRMDHGVAALNVLVRYHHRAIILLGEEDLVFHCPETLKLELSKGDTVSFFPFRPVRGVVSEGLRWSVAGLDFAPGGQGGTSNEALGGQVKVVFEGTGMLVFLALDALDQVVARLSAPAPNTRALSTRALSTRER